MFASMADVARRQQGEYDLETALANLSGSVGQQAALGELYGSMFYWRWRTARGH